MSILPTKSPAANLPVEIWEFILADFSKEMIWRIRSVNRVLYAFAAKSYYEDIWIVPQRQKMVRGTLGRICDRTFARFVTTLHIHSNLESAHRPLITKILSSPHLSNVNKLTLHYDAVVLPYTSLAWLKFSESLVHLEIQFWSISVQKAITSLNSRVRCPNLRTFVLMAKCRSAPPVFHARTTIALTGTMGDTSLGQLFSKLANLLPPELETLAIHCSRGEPFFLREYPNLKGLSLEMGSLSKAKHAVSFLLKHAASLETLTLEDIYDEISECPSSLPLGGVLQELYLTVFTYIGRWNQLYPNSTWRAKIQKCARLRRLEIVPQQKLNEYTRHLYHSDALCLMLSLALAGGTIKELALSVDYLNFDLLETVLFLLPQLSRLKILFVNSCDESLHNLSSDPEALWNWERPNYRHFQFIGLRQDLEVYAKIGIRSVRDMAAHVQKVVNRVSYCFLPTEVEALKGLIEKALEQAEEREVFAEQKKECQNFRKATLRVFERCLVRS
ncbi:hypothetical protein DL96DRAFT_1549722 [Flagelloscypha sp. PMI_526]|nr:hypothetical protein DL96DRAFT_1549722 [Flagelloscypha sp. PMI_526]